MLWVHFIMATKSKIKYYNNFKVMNLTCFKTFLFRHMDQAVILLFWQMTLNVCRSFLVLSMETSKSAVWSVLTNKEE